MKIVIRGVAEAFRIDSEEIVTEAGKLRALDGVAFAEDKCEDYLSDDLFALGIVGGEVSLSFAEDNEPPLCVLTSYHAPRKLKKAELAKLIEETTAQWSDGIGEGGFERAEEFGLEIDIYPSGAEPSVEQFDDGIVVKKPRKNELLDLLNGPSPLEEDAIELAKRGAAILAKDRYGKTVLDQACQNVMPSLVELLLKRGALDEAEDRNNPLKWLTYCNGPDDKFEQTVTIAKRLVECGVEPDAYNDDDRTPLMMAVNRGNFPLTQYLISIGANINAQECDEDNQNSVLMYSQSLEMTQYLLENGADPTLKTAYGKDAYEYQLMNSHQRGFQEMADLIKSHMPS